MINLFRKFHIHPLTIFLLTVGLISGYIKYILVIFMIVFIHELGHVLVASLMRRRIVKVDILPFGGYMSLDALVSEDIWEDLLIAESGIMAQVLLGIIIHISFSMGYIGEAMFKFINTYNIFIITFNLLPICPLDGYKMICLLTEFFSPYKFAHYMTIFVSFVTYGLFIVLNWRLCSDNMLVITFLLFMQIREVKLFKKVCWRFYVERMNHDFCFARKDIQTIDYMFKNRVNYIHNKHEKEFLKDYFTSYGD